MLLHTFCHAPRVGLTTERRFWESGISTWDDAAAIGTLLSNRQRVRRILGYLDDSRAALQARDALFFRRTLPPGEEWRLYRDFQGNVGYIDIETSGPSVEQGDVITTATLFDGRDVRCYIHGENMERLHDDLSELDLVVTYNGDSFDIPYIERYFGRPLEVAHIDLRFILQSLGFTGGLKGCERALGLDRGELSGLDGYFAVLLWRDYLQRGNRGALETLAAYNVEDTVNLERLMVIAYNLKAAETPFGDALTIAAPADPPPSPYLPDMETIARIRRRYGGRR